jgi:hypothetical protein
MVAVQNSVENSTDTRMLRRKSGEKYQFALIQGTKGRYSCSAPI